MMMCLRDSKGGRSDGYFSGFKRVSKLFSELMEFLLIPEKQ